MSVRSSGQSTISKKSEEVKSHKSSDEDGHEQSRPTSRSRSTKSRSKHQHSKTSASAASMATIRSSGEQVSDAAGSEESNRSSKKDAKVMKKRLASLLSTSGTKHTGSEGKDDYSTGRSTLGESSSSKSRLSSIYSKASEANAVALPDYRTDQCLSSDEMRNKLFSTFKFNGVLKRVKTQMRMELASAINKDQNLKIVDKSKAISIAAKISDCIIAEHLKKAKYEYTLSIFKAESLLSEFDFNPCEILALMNVSQDSQMHKKFMLSLSQEKSKSFLWSFITELLPAKIGNKTSAECQTEDSRLLMSNDFYNKMADIEEEVYKTAINDRDYRSLEERLFELQRKMEAEKKKELQMEKQNLKDGLLRKIRFEEKEKNKTELDKHKVDLDKMYKEMFANLKEKEAQMDLMISRKKKQIDKDSYNQRQHLLEELNKLKDRERDLQRQHELAMKSANLEESRLKSISEELKAKEISLKTLEDRYEIRLKEEILKIKTEHQQDRQKHDEFYRQQELKLNEEKTLFESEKALLVKYRNDFESLKNEKAQLKESLISSQQRILVLNHMHGDMKEKLRETADYPRLREAVLLKEKEIDYLKSALNEHKLDKNAIHVQHKKDVRDLLDKFLKGTPETAKLQQQILIEKEEFAEKEKELTLKCREAVKRFSAERARANEVTQMYEECLLQNKALKREVGDLRKRMEATNVGPVKNNKPYNPSHIQSLTQKNSRLNNKKEKIHPYETFDINRTTSFPQTALIDKALSTDDPLSSYEITPLRRTGTVFEQLEREAAVLEETYHDYQTKQIDRYSNRVNFEKSESNYNFLPLQRYESTCRIDCTEMQQKTDKYTSAQTASKENKEKENPSLNAGVYPRKVQNISDSVKVAKNNGHDFNVNDIEQNDKVLLDTWNGDKLTEQLLESAINQQDKVSKIRNFGAKLDEATDWNSSNKPKLKRSNQFAEENHETVVIGDNNNVREMQSALPSFDDVLSQKNELAISAASSVENVTGVGGMDSETQHLEHRDDNAKEYFLENQNKLEINSMDQHESLEGNSVEKVRDSTGSNFLKDEDKSEKTISQELSYIKDLKASGNEISEDDDVKSKSDDKIVTNANESDERSIKNVMSGDEEKENDDDDIDPLMKHYMEMVMKKKNDPEKESEQEQLNLTDDVKIESKLSKSDVSDLVEDELEEIPVESGDDFDW